MLRRDGVVFLFGTAMAENSIRTQPRTPCPESRAIIEKYQPEKRSVKTGGVGSRKIGAVSTPKAQLWKGLRPLFQVLEDGKGTFGLFHGATWVLNFTPGFRG